MPLHVYDLEGEDISSRVLSLRLDGNECVATVAIHNEFGYRFYDNHGVCHSIEVRVSRVKGENSWQAPPQRRAA